MQIQEIIAAVLERTHQAGGLKAVYFCLLYTSPSPRD